MGVIAFIIIMSIIIIGIIVKNGVDRAENGTENIGDQYGWAGIPIGLALGISISNIGEFGIIGGILFTILAILVSIFSIAIPIGNTEEKYSNLQKHKKKQEEDKLKEEIIEELLSKDRSVMSLSDKKSHDEMLFTYGKSKVAKLKGWHFRDVDARIYVQDIMYKERRNPNINIHIDIVREDNNAYDENALKVITIDGLFIGYIPRELAPQLRALITPTAYPFGTIEYCDDNTLIIYMQLGRYETEEECIEDINKIEQKERIYQEKQLELLAEQDRLERRLLAEQANLESGLLAEAEGRFEDAINIYSKLVDNNTRLNKAYERLCILLRKAKRLEDELWAAEKWLEYTNNQTYKSEYNIINVKKRITYIQTKLDKLNS